MDLSKLDPNLVLTLGSLLGTVAVWAYHKVKGDKQEGLRDKLWHVLEGVVIKLAESDDNVSVIREKLTAAARDGMTRMGIKPNAIADLVVAELVERGVTDVRKRILARRTLENTIAATAAQADAVRDAFNPKGTMPKLDIDVQVMP